MAQYVNEKDIKKHKYDVFRLLQIIPADSKINASKFVKENIHKFISEVSKLNNKELNLAQIKLLFNKNFGIALLSEIYK